MDLYRSYVKTVNETVMLPEHCRLAECSIRYHGTPSIMKESVSWHRQEGSVLPNYSTLKSGSRSLIERAHVDLQGKGKRNVSISHLMHLEPIMVPQGRMSLVE